jgi:hypothetical protein
VFIRPTGAGQLQLEYHCTAAACKSKNRILGVYHLDFNDYSWSFVRDEAADKDLNALDDRTVDVSMESDSSEPESTPEKNSYQLVKARFEKECMKVRDPFVYIRIEKKNGTCKSHQLKHTEFRQFYVHLSFYKFEKTKNSKDGKGGAWVKRPFIDIWLADPNKLEVSSIVVDPKGTQTGVHNLWTGFLAARLNPYDFFSDKENVEDFIMAPIRHHLINVITGNQEDAEWLLDWMANMVQRPWLKSGVAVSLYGKQGCGKGIIFENFRLGVLGPNHTFQTADPERDLFDRFSDGLINNVFIQVDEVKSLHDHADKLKNAVTSATVTWEPKNGRIVTVDNICNLLFTSNNENALSLATDDRRISQFRCNPQYKDNKEYFRNFFKHLATPGVNVRFFKILMERDLSKYPYDFQASRPITEYYKESQKVTIPAERRYLSALVNSMKDKDSKWGSSELYLHFRKWAEFEGYKHIKPHVSFGRDISRVDGVTTKKSHGVMRYQMNHAQIKKSLEQANEYDEDSFLLDSVV